MSPQSARFGAGAQYSTDTKFPHSFDPRCHDEARATEGPWRDNARWTTALDPKRPPRRRREWQRWSAIAGVRRQPKRAAYLRSNH